MKHSARRAGPGALALALCLSVLTACGGGGSETSPAAAGPPASTRPELAGCDQKADVTFQLNFAAGGYHAGFALAKEKGYYSQAGLNVEIVQGNGSATTAQLVASGQADLAYADAVPVMQLIGKGAPIKVVSTLYQANPNQVTALAETGITSVADLRGRSLGVPTGSSQVPLLPILFEANGLTEADVELVNLPPTAMVPTLLQKNVDAILGSLDFYGVQLKDRDVETNDYLFADNGVATVSTSIISRDEYLEENPEVVRCFIAASLIGWDEALDDTDGAVEALKATFPQVVEDQARNELDATKILFCRNGAKSLGKAEPEAWKASQEVLAKIGTTPQGTDPTEYYTYDYLPETLPPCES